jgi:hypothetical protein
MPKRKRGSEPTLLDRLEKLQDEVFRALKAAKGFERQRIAKRSRDAGIGEDKKERLDRELSVLKVGKAGRPMKREKLTLNCSTVSGPPSNSQSASLRLAPKGQINRCFDQPPRPDPCQCRKARAVSRRTSCPS